MESNRDKELRLLAQRAVAALEATSQGINTLADAIVDRADTASDALDKLSEGVDTLTNLLRATGLAGGGTEGSETSEPTPEPQPEPGSRPWGWEFYGPYGPTGDGGGRFGLKKGPVENVEEQQESKSLCSYCESPKGSSWNCPVCRAY